ncbi:MAG: hypothetical protein A3F75_07320 [Betaproteobacteria bacterium RIFCSPLOWO2_12_FULL_64_23]|nr:MAG: hypothetical protein A3F75_07320 [Betaproteobacteria bacterium RIFCSPLOWO2_12_FULL_64_23]
MASSGGNTVDLTAIVLSATRQTVSGRTVTFSAGTDATAYVDNISEGGVSDTNGIVTARLNLGGDKVNRTITLTATADSVTATNSVDVTGTTVTISGNSSLAFGAATTLTLAVRDSIGNALKNTTVSVSSKTGNTIDLTPATGITNSSGQISATVTATAAGDDVISASAAGASAAQTLTISADSFAFTTPAKNPDGSAPQIDLGAAGAVSINWTNAGVAQVGQQVTFSASRGTVAGGNPATTDAAGDTSGVTVSSTTAGPAIITAYGPGGTPAATLDVIFVATSAASATVQAIPGTVQVTTGSPSQSNNSSTITVQVRDAANNLVKDAGVSFTITSDNTGGGLTSSTGLTDISGSASVTYIAGGTSSAQNGVIISATVTAIRGVPLPPPVVTGTTTLTVSGQSLQVRLGTDNTVGTTPLPQNANVKTYVAIVTDAAGNPVVNTTVQFALRPSRYRKGFFVPDPTGIFWVQNITATCPNEDLNFNGILDPGEGLVAWPAGVTPALLPGAVASVNATAVTDTGGAATATLTYAKSYSLWTEVTLEARTSVTTNDPPTQQTFFLPGVATDYDNVLENPPGQPSPFGINTSCADTL